MRTSPAPYTKDITALLEKQERIYEEWLNGQHNIFERYMKGFEYMFGGMKKKKNGSIKRSIKRSRWNPLENTLFVSKSSTIQN